MRRWADASGVKRTTSSASCSLPTSITASSATKPDRRQYLISWDDSTSYPASPYRTPLASDAARRCSGSRMLSGGSSEIPTLELRPSRVRVGSRARKILQEFARASSHASTAPHRFLVASRRPSGDEVPRSVLTNRRTLAYRAVKPWSSTRSCQIATALRPSRRCPPTPSQTYEDDSHLD